GLQEACARDRREHHRAEHDDGARDDEDRALREERYRLDGRQEDVRVGRAREYLHGCAQTRGLHGRLHQRLPDQDRASEGDALSAARRPSLAGAPSSRWIAWAWSTPPPAAR